MKMGFQFSMKCWVLSLYSIFSLYSIGRGAKGVENEKHERSDNVHPHGSSPCTSTGHPPLGNLLGDLCTHCGGEPPHPAGDHGGFPPPHSHVLFPGQLVLHRHVVLHRHCAQNADDLGLPGRRGHLLSQLCGPALLLSLPGEHRVFPLHSHVLRPLPGHQSAAQTTLTFRLPYCGPSQIQHYFCDGPPILRLACADTSMNERVIFVNIGVVASGCFLLIVGSYVSIVCSILKIRTSEGRCRAFQTCTSHCIVVLCFFVPCVFVYLRPGSKDAVDRIVAVFYTVLTPLLNPVVYTLRNKEVKKALLKLQDKVT
uniref:G-protein coupled receptors family 1 profile domain-containing protein n=1 Tax=Felis catus TaxID=9685 RepID=A0ABI7Z3B2_FELCA